MDRFVAGPQFYNFDMLGSLRAGDAVHVRSRAHFGLGMSAFASAFVYIGLRSGLLAIVCAQLQFSPLETQAVDRLAELPAAFAFFVGVTADARPLVGFHRKTYMITGLLFALLSLFLLSAAFCFDAMLRAALGRGFVYLVTLLVGCVSVGSMVTFVSTHAMVVALSQRESLEARGVLQVKYLLARVSGQIVARLAVFSVTQARESLHVPLALLALSAVSIFSLAATITCLLEDEDYVQRSIRRTYGAYWTLTQQKVVWRVLGFVASYAFALGFRVPQAQRALQHWSRIESQPTVLLVSIANDCVAIGTLVVWRRCYMNSLWRRAFAAGPVAAIGAQALLLGLTTPGVVRDPVFYTLTVSLTGIASAFVALSTLVPVTEIAQVGSEGGVAGLALSFYTVSKVFASTCLSALQRIDALALDDPIEDDTRRVRELVAAAQVLTIGANALAFAGIALLPLQKLDAQQLRTFGGFTRMAGRATVAVFVALLLYCAVFNALMLVPAAACALDATARCSTRRADRAP